MSSINLYTTKALGREWKPSPVRSHSQIGRFSNLDAPNMRWDSLSTLGNHPTSRTKRSRVHERTVLIIGILITLCIWNSGLHLEGGLYGHRNIAWHDFAYGTYATSTSHLCNSVMLVEALHRLGAQADTFILYDASLGNTTTGEKLLRRAHEDYGAKLKPVAEAAATRDLASNQTEYKTLLVLDSDITLFRPLDDLFLLPPPVQIPGQSFLTLTTPVRHNRQQQQQQQTREEDENETTTTLPRRPHYLLTTELKDLEEDIQQAMEAVKVVHFSDSSPPWVRATQQDWDEGRGWCSIETGCAAREA